MTQSPKALLHMPHPFTRRALVLAVMTAGTGAWGAPGEIAPMSAGRFWRLIDEARVGAKGDRAFIGRLVARLTSLGAEEIVAFARQFDRVDGECHTWALWGAAYVINGGCSDDCFDYFCGWLIARGERVYRKVLANPDVLVELTSGITELEDMLSVAYRAYQRRTGRELPRPTPLAAPLPVSPPGWDFDDGGEMKKRYPRLCARYGC